MKKLLAFLLFLPALAFAQHAGVQLERAPIDLNNKTSLQHGAAIDRGAMTPFGYIVPGSGTGDLKGIRGEVRIGTDTLTLTYEFES